MEWSRDSGERDLRWRHSRYGGRERKEMSRDGGREREEVEWRWLERELRG